MSDPALVSRSVEKMTQKPRGDPKDPTEIGQLDCHTKQHNCELDHTQSTLTCCEKACWCLHWPYCYGLAFGFRNVLDDARVIPHNKSIAGCLLCRDRLISLIEQVKTHTYYCYFILNININQDIQHTKTPSRVQVDSHLPQNLLRRK